MKRAALALVLLALTGGTVALSNDCASEDAPMCYWDASTHGNGSGHDVLNIAGPVHIVFK